MLTAFLEGSPPPTLVTPAALRAPELVLGDQLATGLDMWSFGCLIFELITNHSLFQVESLDGDRFDETTNDEHLIQITETIQPLPEVLFKKWPRASMYYGPTGERLSIHNNVHSSDVGSNEERPDTEGDLTEMEEGHWFDDETDTESQGQVSLASSRHFDSLEKRFRDVKPADIDEREEEEILRLIRLALQPDVATRASAAQLLQQAWFQE
jgi:serine/threonine protein kinase